MLNLGGPWTLDDVRPFLESLFRDREIIAFPGGPALQGVWARLISTLRTPKVRERYARIGGGSPLLYWTRIQGLGLERLLNGAAPALPDEAPTEQLRSLDCRDPGVLEKEGEGRFLVALAMRYSPPTASSALSYLKEKGCRRVVVLPLYPQECRATTGSSLADLERARDVGNRLVLRTVRSFHDHPKYVRALAERVREGLALFPEDLRGGVTVLFSAHAIPLSLVREGDRYTEHVQETVNLLMGELGGEVGSYRLAYQSRTGPVRWTGPGTDEVISDLGEEKAKGVLLVPISFVSDHIETLHEVDIEFAEIARESGVAHFHRAPSLNGSPLFLEALRDLVVEELENEDSLAGEAEGVPRPSGRSVPHRSPGSGE